MRYSRRRFLRYTAAGLCMATGAGAAENYRRNRTPESMTRILVPVGLTPRIIARSGYRASPNSNYLWHAAPDGGACFNDAERGWIYLSTSETWLNAGVGALRFNADGEVIDCYSILSGTRMSCSGGKTPWNTWLSCEEVDNGLVWECDPFNRRAAFALPGLGVFKHESASVDPASHRVYLTEDENDGCLYRFTPARVSLSGVTNLGWGKLQAARVDGGRVSWLDVPDPIARDTPLRYQLTDSSPFRGGEGIDIFDHWLRFTTKRDNRVWQIDLRDDRIEMLYDLSRQLQDVDDITHSRDGSMLIAEDGPGMRVLYFGDVPGPAKLLLQLPDHHHSEVTGLAFDPSGTRLYFSSYRGNTTEKDHGITFELRGDFANPAFTSPLVAMVFPAVCLSATDDSRYELSARLNLVGATGTPSNDILGYGVILHRRLSDDWYLGFSIEHSPEFDVERPNEELDIDSSSETDAVASMSMVTAVAERRYALGEGVWTGFWNLGVGVASIDADNAKGDVEGGGKFDIKVDADTETVLLGGAGVMQRLGENWSARYEATIEQHFADWKATDRVSGATGSYADYSVSGVRLGLSYRF